MYKKITKKRRDLLQMDSMVFQTNLRDFVEGEIPCALFVHHPVFKKDPWFKATAYKREVQDCLRGLYESYGILPAPVLLILAKTKHLMLTRPFMRLRDDLRDKDTRKRHVRALDEALLVLDTYGLMPETYGQDFEWKARGYLKLIKAKINEIVTRKEPDVEMRFCAQTLQTFFRSVTGRSLNEEVGELLVHAHKWPRGNGDLRLAALQRAKGRSLNATRTTLSDAIDMQNENYGYWGKILAEDSEDMRLLGEMQFLKLLVRQPNPVFYQRDLLRPRSLRQT